LDIRNILGSVQWFLPKPGQFRICFGWAKNVGLDHRGALIAHLVTGEVNLLLFVPRGDDHHEFRAKISIRAIFRVIFVFRLEIAGRDAFCGGK